VVSVATRRWKNWRGKYEEGGKKSNEKRNPTSVTRHTTLLQKRKYLTSSKSCNSTLHAGNRERGSLGQKYPKRRESQLFVDRVGSIGGSLETIPNAVTHAQYSLTSKTLAAKVKSTGRYAKDEHLPTKLLSRRPGVQKRQKQDGRKPPKGVENSSRIPDHQQRRVHSIKREQHGVKSQQSQVLPQ